ncbi:hypothetical protein SKAU_G00162770 [Synaphobranchus kaupii]|uniref:Uncharacterized protein n=1 Tax=Synaphobranchus kaupii TaxID=118154 RepID=A0A9Q1FIU4_SYNKA|nr:hypothetical protein SKAU_G00162770 [Synaphobranchus kaupii]
MPRKKRRKKEKDKRLKAAAKGRASLSGWSNKLLLQVRLPTAVDGQVRRSHASSPRLPIRGNCFIDERLIPSNQGSSAYRRGRITW